VCVASIGSGALLFLLSGKAATFLSMLVARNLMSNDLRLICIYARTPIGDSGYAARLERNRRNCIVTWTPMLNGQTIRLNGAIRVVPQ
jgi:hypothetical protein